MPPGNSITIKISANNTTSPAFAQVIAGLQQLGNQAQQTGKKIQSAGRDHDAVVGAITRLKQAVVAYLSINTAAAILREADAWTRMRNLLSVVTNTTTELFRVQEKLYQLSQDSRSGMQSSVVLYARLARSVQQLGYSENQVLTVTKAINQAYIVSGATAQEQYNSMIQLAQGLASNTLRADELRSVMEQAPYLAMKMAEGLGIPFTKFREWSLKGKLDAQSLLDALLKMSKSINTTFSNTTMTMEQGFTKVKNAVGYLIDELNRSLGVTRTLGGLLGGIADALDRIRTGKSGEQLYLEREAIAGLERSTKADQQKILMEQMQAIVTRSAGVLPANAAMMTLQELEAARDLRKGDKDKLVAQIAQMQTSGQGSGSPVFVGAQRGLVGLATRYVESALLSVNPAKQNTQIPTLGKGIEAMQQEVAAGDRVLAMYSELIQARSKYDALPEDPKTRAQLAAEELATALQTVEDAFQATEKSAPEVSSAIAQMNGFMTSGTVNTRQLVHILEEFPEIGKKMAAGLKMGYGEFRVAAEKGEISAEQLIQTFADGSQDILDKAYEKGDEMRGKALREFQTARKEAETQLEKISQIGDRQRVTTGELQDWSKRINAARTTVELRAVTEELEHFITRMRNADEVFKDFWQKFHNVVNATLMPFRAQDAVELSRTSRTRMMQAGVIGNLTRRHDVRLTQGYLNAAPGEERAAIEAGVMRPSWWGAKVKPGTVPTLSQGLGLVQYKKDMADVIRQQEPFAWNWEHLGHSVKTMWLNPGGIFDGISKGIAEFRRQLGSFSQIIQNATISGLQTMRSGISDAFGDLLFGDEELGAVKDALKYLNNSDMEALNSAVEAIESLVLNKTGEGTKIGDRTADWILAFFDSAQSIDNLPDSFKKRLADLAVQVQGFFANATEETRVPLIENILEFIENYRQKPGFISRLEQFGADMVDAIKEGWKTFTVDVLTDLATSALAAFAEGLLKGLTGINTDQAKDFGKKIGESLREGLGDVTNWFTSGVEFTIGAVFSGLKSLDSGLSWLWEKIKFWDGSEETKKLWANYGGMHDSFIPGIDDPSMLEIRHWYDPVTKPLKVALEYGFDKAGELWGLIANAGIALTKTIKVALGYGFEKTGELWTMLANVGIEVTKTIKVALGYGFEKSGELWTMLANVGIDVTKTIKVALGYGFDKVTSELWSMWANATVPLEKTINLVVNTADKTWELLTAVTEPISKVVTTVLKSGAAYSQDVWAVFQAVNETVSKTVYTFLQSGAAYSTDVWSVFVAKTTDATKVVYAYLKKGAEWLVDSWALFKAETGEVTRQVWAYLKQGNTWTTDLWSLFTAGSAQVSKTVLTWLEQGATWTADVWSVFTAVTDTAYKYVYALLKPGNTYAPDVLEVFRGVSETVYKTVVATLEAGKVDEALTAATETVYKTVYAILKSGYSYSADVWEIFKAQTETVYKTVYASLKSGYNYASDIWSIFVAKTSEATKVVYTYLKKGAEWITDVWSLFTATNGDVTKTVWAFLKQGVTWGADLWSVFAAKNEEVSKTVWAWLKQGAQWTADCWELFTAKTLEVSKTVWAYLKQGATWTADLWDLFKSQGGEVSKTIWGYLKQAPGQFWEGIGDAWVWISSTSPISRFVEVALRKGENLIGSIGSNLVDFWTWLGGTPVGVKIDLWLEKGGDLIGDLIDVGGSAVGGVWDWLTGKIGDFTKSIHLSFDTDGSETEPFWPFGDKFQLDVADSFAAGMTIGIVTALATGGTGQMALISGIAAGVGAALLQGVEDVGLVGGAGIGAAIVQAVPALYQAIVNPHAQENMRDLQLAVAQRGGLVGALKYGLGLGTETPGGFNGANMVFANPELRQAMKEAERTDAIDYLSETLRTSMQIGERAADILAEMVYWEDLFNVATDPEELKRLGDAINYLTDWDIKDLEKAFIDLGLATESTIATLMDQLDLYARAAKPVTSGDSAEGTGGSDDTPLAAAVLIVDAINAAKASIVFALTGGVPKYASGTLAVPGSPSTPVPAILHGGEMVLPYSTAERVRRGDLGGGTTVNFHFHISGTSDDGLVRVFRDRVLPEVDRHVTRMIAQKSKYGQLEVNSRALRSTMR